MSYGHPNLSKRINDAMLRSEIEGGIHVTAPEAWATKCQGEPVLAVGCGLRVRTQNNTYIIRKVLGDAEDGTYKFTIQGHPDYCPVAVPCVIHGSTFGGSMLKVGWVGVGMYLEFYIDYPNPGVITTSCIRSLEEIP